MEKEYTTEQKGYGKRPLWQWVVIYLVIGVVIYGIIYYLFIAKKGGYASSYSNRPQNTSSQNVNTTQQNANVTQVVVTGTEFAFDPSVITVKAGQPVQLTFSNKGTYPHNLSIADLNVKTQTIQPGEQDTVTFTPDQAGSYAFSCTVPGHADQGMTGTIEVQ